VGLRPLWVGLDGLCGFGDGRREFAVAKVHHAHQLVPLGVLRVLFEDQPCLLAGLLGIPGHEVKTAQLQAGLEEIRVELDRLAECRIGLAGVARPKLGHAELELGLRVVGVDLQDVLELDDGLAELVLRQVGLALLEVALLLALLAAAGNACEENGAKNRRDGQRPAIAMMHQYLQKGLVCLLQSFKIRFSADPSLRGGRKTDAVIP